MANGYWIITGTIHTPLGMVNYISSLHKWLERIGGKILVRDLDSDIREGEPGDVNIVIEFESKDTAIAAYESQEYQDMIQLRISHSNFSLAITEQLVN